MGEMPGWDVWVRCLDGMPSGASPACTGKGPATARKLLHIRNATSGDLRTRVRWWCRLPANREPSALPCTLPEEKQYEGVASKVANFGSLGAL